MSIFNNPFLSVAGQSERLQNVGNTLVSSLTGKGVKSNTGNANVDKVLSAVASNPYTTALAVTPVNTIKAGGALFSSLPTGGKVAVGIATPIVISASLSNPTLIKSTAELPKTVSQLGGISSWNDLKDFGKAHPVVSTGVIIGGGVAIGSGVSGLIASAINTSAIKENTQATINNFKETMPQITNTPIQKSNVGGTETPLTTPTLPQSVQTVGYKNTNAVSKPKAKRKTLYRSPINVTNRINIFNKND